MRSVLGVKLVAYIAGVDEARTVGHWADGCCVPSIEIAEVLHLAYRIVRLMEESAGTAGIAAWFQGMNPLLNDRSPARVLREDHGGGAYSEVLTAVESWVHS